jgi:hypothetical protein
MYFLITEYPHEKEYVIRRIQGIKFNVHINISELAKGDPYLSGYRGSQLNHIERVSDAQVGFRTRLR